MWLLDDGGPFVWLSVSVLLCVFLSGYAFSALAVCLVSLSWSSQLDALFLFLKNLTFRHCSCGVGFFLIYFFITVTSSFVLHMSGNTHCIELTNAKFSVTALWKATCWRKSMLLCLSNCVICGTLVDSANTMWSNDVFLWQPSSNKITKFLCSNDCVSGLLNKKNHSTENGQVVRTGL